MHFLPFLCLLFWTASALAADTGVELYLYGEKPGLASPTPYTQMLRLNFARDSSMNLIVRYPEKDQTLVPLTDVQWKGAAFLGAATQVKAYALGVQNIQHSSFSDSAPTIKEIPEILIPNDILLNAGFHIPHENIPSSPEYLLEIHVPDQAFPGTYPVKLSFRRKNKLQEIPLEIKIYRAKLAKNSYLKTSFGFAPWGAMLKQYGKWIDKELELNKNYFSLALANRIDLHKFYIRNATVAEMKSSRNDPLLSGGKISFMQFWDLLTDGSLTPYQYTASTTDIPVLDEEKKAPTAYYWHSLEVSLRNHSLLDHGFVYFADEPKEKDFPALALSLEKIHQLAPEIHMLVTHHYDSRLDGKVDLWCPNLSEWEIANFPSAQFYQERLVKKKEKFWLYTSCNAHGCSSGEDLHIPDLVSDRPSAYARAFPWMAYYYHAEGILYYNTVEAYGSSKSSPWEDPFLFHGNGEGNLFYPCNRALCGVEAVFPSLRLKILRDGIEDIEILHQAELLGAPVRKWMQEAVRGVRDFSTQTALFEKIKIKALSAVEATLPTHP